MLPFTVDDAIPAGNHEHPIGLAARQHDAMKVVINPGNLGKAFASVARHQQSADLDVDVPLIAHLRVESDSLHVRLMRRSGKAPAARLLHGGNSGDFTPRLAEVSADIQVRGLGAAIEYGPTGLHPVIEHEHILRREAGICAHPIRTAIGALVQTCAMSSRRTARGYPAPDGAR